MEEVSFEVSRGGDASVGEHIVRPLVKVVRVPHALLWTVYHSLLQECR